MLCNAELDIQQKEKKKNFKKAKIKTKVFYISHFDYRHASLNMADICLQPLQN